MFKTTKAGMRDLLGRFRRIVILCAVVISVSVVSGCAAEETRDESSPSIGDCWQLESAQQDRSWNSASSLRVSCSSSSNAYTYAAGVFSQVEQDSYLFTGFLKSSRFDDLPPAIKDTISTYCQEELSAFLEDASPGEVRSSRIVWSVSIPTTSQWTSGSRWFSCEAGILREGSPYAKALLQESTSGVLPLLLQAARNPSTLGLCVETSSNSVPPTAPTSQVEKCSQARWKMHQVALETASSGFYPGDIVASELVEQICTTQFPRAIRVVPAKLTENMWRGPEPSIGCWVSTEADSTPSATPTSSPTPSTVRRVPAEPPVEETVPEPEPAPEPAPEPEPEPTPEPEPEPPL